MQHVPVISGNCILDCPEVMDFSLVPQYGISEHVDKAQLPSILRPVRKRESPGWDSPILPPQRRKGSIRDCTSVFPFSVSTFTATVFLCCRSDHSISSTVYVEVHLLCLTCHKTIYGTSKYTSYNNFSPN